MELMRQASGWVNPGKSCWSRVPGVGSQPPLGVGRVEVGAPLLELLQNTKLPDAPPRVQLRACSFSCKRVDASGVRRQASGFMLQASSRSPQLHTL